MVDTLGELAQRYPGHGLVLLLGSDQYAALSTWHEPERVAAGRPIRHLVPDPVRELIEAEGLYR
jgi:nicotinic acid mononucleotide adenylyltransferase